MSKRVITSSIFEFGITSEQEAQMEISEKRTSEKYFEHIKSIRTRQ